MVNASCHCGNLSLTLETSVDPRELPLRARAWAIVNVNAVPDQDPFKREAEPVSYEGETAEQRIARRKARWTPAEVVEGGLP